MITSEIKKMSTVERLQAMEELWDALCHEDKEVESPVWHKEILDERKKKIERGEAEFISIEELKAKTNQ
ncbi:MAG: addiction module protein [Candidatus Brocadiaceae bacterium]|nr:addiction module protein [Candidatus Brocadiaceae bacterium]